VSKKITVIGTGYVGLVASVGLADFGHTIIAVDIDKNKVKTLSQGISIIYEPGIQEYLKRNIESKRLRFTTDIDSAVREAEVIFIAVGTPPKENGETDLSQIQNAIISISKNLNNYKVIVTKSTVPVGTNRWIKEEIKRRTGNSNYDVVSNPEFLREGKALYDFFHPDRVVVGLESEEARKIIEEIYQSLYLIQIPFIWCNFETAELIKYAGNAFLAAKITFINQMANLAETVNADIHLIAKAMGMDGRISSKFLHPGPGYGGSCFPKDTRALVQTAGKHNINMSLVKEAINANEEQKLRMVSKLYRLVGDLKDKTVAVFGLSFKEETDDIRESPSIAIVKRLLDQGVKVRAHDPIAISNFQKLFKEVNYFKDEFEAAQGAHAVVICTAWNEYRNLDLEKLKEVMVGNIILDTRNVLNSENAKKMDFIYEGVGRK
jgi:UDPglucose 6-dehydrogenase